MASEHFAYIWRYTIKPAHKRAFLEAYEPKGEWAQLFSRDSAYIETVLLRDDDDKNRYVTIDFWRSKADRDAFRARYAVEFNDLDRKCEELTEEEQLLGDFHEINTG